MVDGHYCTLTTIGHDKTGELVGFNAAHCGGPGAQVVAEGTDTTVGTVVATGNRGETASRSIIEWNGSGADRIFLHHIG